MDNELIEKAIFWTGAIIVAIIIGGIACLFMAILVKLLWNWLMPNIFGLKTITFWQAFGLSFLCDILFKSHSSSSKKSKD